jgi:hypothetical protein
MVCVYVCVGVRERERGCSRPTHSAGTNVLSVRVICLLVCVVLYLHLHTQHTQVAVVKGTATAVAAAQRRIQAILKQLWAAQRQLQLQRQAAEAERLRVLQVGGFLAFILYYYCVSECVCVCVSLDHIDAHAPLSLSLHPPKKQTSHTYSITHT